MAMHPDPTGSPTQARPEPPAVEWEIIERTPGDPWSAELVVWRGDDIDGVNLAVDNALIDAVVELRRRQDDISGLDGAADDPGDPAAPDSRARSLLQGLGRTTGASQADRWLSGVPVKFQIAGAVALLVVFVLVMVIGNFT